LSGMIPAENLGLQQCSVFRQPASMEEEIDYMLQSNSR
jgi:hypothetical protein